MVRIVRSEMRTTLETCRVRGHAIAYRREGRGEPVLLLHGITTHSVLWRDVVPLLASDHEVVAIDLLGCGASDKPLDVSYALRDRAERFPALLDALGLPSVHLVGHDLGGGIAQIVSVRHPERLRSVTVVNSVGYDYWPVQPITSLRVPFVRQLLLAAVDVGALALIIRRAMYHQEKVTPELIEALEAPLRTADGRRAFAHWARCLDNRDLTSIVPELGRIRLPFGVVWGDADPFLTARIPERLHAEISGSRLFRIATASHYLPLDEPEWLAGVIREVTGAGRAA
jgi:pimeloyl-ACP methyl ester carboxylesterase